MGETMECRVDEFFGGAFPLFAHRGLHETGHAENSMEAFQAARDQGFAIELDVTLCASGELLLFHDERIEESEDLERPEALLGRIQDLSYDAIKAAKFKETGTVIPTLNEVLEELRAEVPVIVEIKIREIFQWTRARQLAKAVLEVVKSDSYAKNRLLLASFHPVVLVALKDSDDSYFRSQIVESYSEHSAMSRALWKKLMFKLPMSEKSRPDVLMTEHFVVDKERVELRHAQGYRLLPWLTDHRNLLKGHEKPEESEAFRESVLRLKNIGVSGIITDHPMKAREILS
ncbi:MAG: glycerophosphodiester phosphodiesterase family protein [Planctomycetota bacterium]|nr:glycerophosphodiester phosphodiesterase family protein [Planctomycetota bacterium]